MSQSGGGGGEESSEPSTSASTSTTSLVSAEMIKIANRNLSKQLIIDVPSLFEPILRDIDHMIKTETTSLGPLLSGRRGRFGEIGGGSCLNKSSRFNRLLDFYQECTSSKKRSRSTAAPPVNLMPELSVDVTEQGSDVFVNLTWTIRDLNRNQMVNGDTYDWSSLNIAEYELYGYQSTPDESLSTLDPDQLFSIGTMQPHIPPVTCTLSDFLTDHVYFLTVRIKYNDNTYSEYSNLRRVYVSRAQNDLSF